MLFASTEPTSAALTTLTRPSLSANRQMKSSGRFPSADWTAPAAPEPSREPSCSVARADGAREHRDRGRRDDEREHGRRVEVVRESRREHEQRRRARARSPLACSARPARGLDATNERGYLASLEYGVLAPARRADATYSRTMLRRSLILASALACACALAGPALGSQLIDRNASHISLKVNRQGMALLTYKAHGSWHHVLAWGAINARVPPGGRHADPPAGEAPARLLRRVGQVPQDHLAGLQERLPAVQRPQARLVRDRVQGPDGSYWAVQAWQTDLPDLGFLPWTTKQSAWHLDLSHWTGPLANVAGVHGLDLRRPLPRHLRAPDLQGAARSRVPHAPATERRSTATAA